jgi:cell wall integrity and stress response component
LTTVTVDGIIKTVTATPSPTGSSDPALLGNTASQGLQTGAIVGIVIGVVGGLAVIAAFLWLWFSRRRRQNQDDAPSLGSPGKGSGSPGVMGTPKVGEVAENRYAGAAAGPADTQYKRRSHLMPVDPRLDPFATGLYAGDQNRSRESFNSVLQDSQDYSRRIQPPQRVLRATNPDPDDD